MHSSGDASHGQHGDKKKSYVIMRRIGLGVLAALIFLSGIAVGNGQLSVGRPNPANSGLPENLNYQSVERVYDTLKASYDGKLNEAKLLDGLKAGLAEATGDPYTQYFNQKEAEEFNNQLNGSFTGIGAQLGEDEDGNIIIVSPIDGFPASKAGLRPQDMIVSIDGKTTADLTIDEAVSKIRGPKDTKVKLGILRNKTEDLNFTIIRDDIKIPSVKYEMLEGKVGLITVNQFSDDTTILMEEAARSLKGQGVKRIMLDLRGNPGGLLGVAVEMAELWLPEGKVILQERRGGVTSNTFVSETAGTPPLQGVPTVVLINAGSASASEIVAGALRDHNAATLYGTKSYGKGSVQEIRKVRGGGELKVTAARWYRPNGQNIDKKGIKPDVEIKMTEEDYAKGKDPQKDAALKYLLKQ